MMRTFLPLALAIGLSCASAFAASPWNNCRALERHGKRAEAKACFERLIRASDSLSRAEGSWGLRLYDDAPILLHPRVRRSARDEHDMGSSVF